MDLIKENKQRKRAIYKIDDTYKKVWNFKDIEWLDNHVNILNEYVPGYVKQHGWNNDTMWIIFDEIKGIPASKFDHSPTFISKIYNFCLKNIELTKPYAHGDWVLSNIIINGDNMYMIDWDNINLYPEKDIFKKLHNDLRSAFGDKFDPSSL